MSKLKFKNIRSICIIYLCLLVLFCVAPLLIPFEKGLSSWICYGTTIFSFFISAFILYISFKNNNNIKSLLYGLPIAKVGLLYVLVQVVISIIIFIILKI